MPQHALKGALIGLLVTGMGVAPPLSQQKVAMLRRCACPRVALARLYGGTDELPLWSFPTDPIHAGQTEGCNEEEEVQLPKTMPTGDGASTSHRLRLSAGEDAERYRHLEAARALWWKGETEAADRAFLRALSWYRTPIIMPPHCPQAAASNESSQERPQSSRAWQDSYSSQNCVTPDGGLRWTAARPLSRPEQTSEEANAMCEYAAFLVEATAEREAAGKPRRRSGFLPHAARTCGWQRPEISGVQRFRALTGIHLRRLHVCGCFVFLCSRVSFAKNKQTEEAEHILRSVLGKEPLHDCAIQVLGDLLETGALTLFCVSCHTRARSLRAKLGGGETETGDTTKSDAGSYSAQLRQTGAETRVEPLVVLTLAPEPRVVEPRVL